MVPKWLEKKPLILRARDGFTNQEGLKKKTI